MSLLLAFAAPLLLAQVGPFTTPGPQPVSPLPPELQNRGPRRRAQSPPPPPPPTLPPTASTQESRLQLCLADAASSPDQAADAAEEWLGKAQGAERAQARECLGVAQGRLDRWDDARTSFLAARDLVDPVDRALRARLGAMAGNAALAAGDAAGALAALDPARAEALAAKDDALTAGIAIDRARALVSLKREPEAATALAEARASAPGNAQAWLLSATLSRRQGKLADAQAQIQRAAELLPVDPEIGLEAGLIAVLSGRDEAARKSWQSVIAAAPQSDAAATARTYLGQLGPAPAGATTGRR